MKRKKLASPKKEIKFQAKKKMIFLYLFLIIILGFSVYFNSLNGKFLLDDENLIKDNGYIKSWSKLPNLLTEDIMAGTGFKSAYYRPLQMITYMIDYSIWRLNVMGYHLTNTLLHIFVALCVYWLIIILFEDRLLSFLTAILFLVHPIHTEAVAYISSRADPLSSLFMLLCLILYIRKGLYSLMVLFYIVALLSREGSLILPALLLVYYYVFKKNIDNTKYFPILAITSIYILLRLTVLRHLLPSTTSTTSLLERLPGFFVAITNYLRLLFLPFGLHMEYGNKLFSFFEPKAAIGVAISLSLLTYAFIKRRANNLFFFSISWFFIALLPFSNLYPINAYMAEHWLYMPSIGFFLILAKGLSYMYRAKELKIFTAALIIGLLTFYSYLTIRQNGYWKESIAFYQRTLKYAPESSKMHNNLARAYSNIGKNEEAIPLYKKAIEINPNYAIAYFNLGNAYKAMGKNDEAIASYENALKINPNDVDVYINLGNRYTAIGKLEEAIATYKKAIEINPNYITAYVKLGNIYLSIGKTSEAIVFFKKTIEIDSNYAWAHNNLAVAYYGEKQYDLAIKYCDRAIKLGYRVNPEFLEALKPYRK